MQFLIPPTKVAIPPEVRQPAPRSHLMERLTRGVEGRLTLVSAPAGYGKTTLLSAWSHQCELPVAWISLDEGDNDPVRFLRVLIAALETIQPGTGQGCLELIRVPNKTPWEEILPNLLIEIAQITQPFVLILDDYHLIHEAAIHACLVYLLQQLPRSAHWIIASRADPPLQIARLRARNELTELRLTDLCFDLEEATSFFNQVMKLNLSSEQAAVLNSRTEGWIAGLQLAAVSMQAVSDRPEFIRSFSGSNRFILDYLADEVLLGLTADIQTFLVQTSILNRLSGPLCNAVTGRSDSQQMLEHLEQANLFLIPIDTERTWYRYHQLFRDLLLKQALRQSSDELAGLRRKAAEWFGASGMIGDAIEYSLAANDLNSAAGLIKIAAPTALMRGEIYTFRNWVNQLPEDQILRDPELAIYFTWILALSDSPRATVEAWLGRLDQSLKGFTPRITIVRGFLEFMQGNATGAVRLLQIGQAELPADDDIFHYIADYALSTLYVMLGDLDTGAQALEQTAQTALRRGQMIWAAGAMCELGEIHMRRGELHAAKMDFERALAAAVDEHNRPLPVAGRAHMRLGELAREWNDLQKAMQECHEGISLAKRLREGAVLPGYLTLAETLQAAGDPHGAQQAMFQAEEIAWHTKETSLDDLIVACFRAALALRQGRLTEVQAWARERGITGSFDPADLDCTEDYYKYHVLKYELIVLSRLWIAAGSPQEALPVLDILRQKMEAQGRVHQLIEIHLLTAIANHQLGESIQAQSWFERSLALAEPSGYMRIFLDEGAAIHPLLKRASRGKHRASYAARLLEALEVEAPIGATNSLSVRPSPARAQRMPPTEVPEGTPIAALTEREVELLRLIADGLTNQEIARQLYISLPTVKWHTSNIYAKLGVHSRTQAIIQARSLGIL